MRRIKPTTHAKDRDLHAPDSRVALGILDAEEEALMFGIDEAGSPQINDSEAGNLAFILSDRFSRNGGWRIMLDMNTSEPRMAEIAGRVAQRLDALSLRLGNERARSRLNEEMV